MKFVKNTLIKKNYSFFVFVLIFKTNTVASEKGQIFKRNATFTEQFLLFLSGTFPVKIINKFPRNSANSFRKKFKTTFEEKNGSLVG